MISCLSRIDNVIVLSQPNDTLRLRLVFKFVNELLVAYLDPVSAGIVKTETIHSDNLNWSDWISMKSSCANTKGMLTAVGNNNGTGMYVCTD